MAPAKPPALSDNSIALLDLLRALAVNLVVVGHASRLLFQSTFPTGVFGVVIFFLLSGFLITRSGINRLQRPGRHFAPFMIDRFSRIFTPYVPALLFVVAVNASVDIGSWGLEGTSTGVLAFFGNLLLLQDYPVFPILHHIFIDPLHIRPYNTAEQFWTIPIEFWIYVAFGCGFFAMTARERLDRPLPIALLIVALPVVIWNVVAGGGNCLTMVWLMGAMVAFGLSAGWHDRSHTYHVGLAVVCLGALCTLGRGLRVAWDPEELGLALCETVLLIGLILFAEGAPTVPAWVRRACAVLASYSYSLYLIHNTVIILVVKFAASRLGAATLPVALIAGHLAAIALYWLFERHHRTVAGWLKELTTRRSGSPVLAAG
jgi:peptidoglycan/LPS O-acetylase OafA/YrhL